MGFWNFIGGFALFNLVCDLFSGKPKQQRVAPRQHFRDYEHDDYTASGIDLSDIDDLQDRVDELEQRLAETDVMSDRYDELQDRIDELQDRIDYLEDLEDMQDELDDLRDELDDLELDRDLYEDEDDW